MTKFKLFGAAVLFTLISSAASAQPVIDEPGMFAFVHPNGDLGIGTSRPPAESMAMTPRVIMRHSLPSRQVKARK
jgi:hypothetical protein